MQKPSRRPVRPHFSSGPCAKPPGWRLEALAGAVLGRSHRGKAALSRIREVIDRSRALLGVPSDYRIAVVPASDTGAIEMAMWSLLGTRGVDMLAWENFGQEWAADLTRQLKLKDCRVLSATYGRLPDLGEVDPARDVVFAWNGTTSGVRVPDGDWISERREGLTICDATSAVFAMPMPWDKLDVATWSWQKVLGGEAGHGMLALSPRAVARLESHNPAWPVPKIFNLTKGGKLNEGLFRGETINTPSMLCVEDAIEGLRWAERVGGLPGLCARAEASAAIVAAWVERTPWIEYLAVEPNTRTVTSICLTMSGPEFLSLGLQAQWDAVLRISELLEAEGVAYDINGHRAAPPNIRIWCGATVESADIEALLPWIEWAYDTVRERSFAPIR